jgi:FMN hydrolase / 5-amino-6-(5-phospho-D-ribitylamino)uracil phosphatase
MMRQMWDFDRVMQRALTRTLAELQRLLPGPATAALSTDRLIAVRDEVAEGLYGQGTTMEEIRLAAFARTLELLGRPDPPLAAHLTTFYLERRFADIELYPDVLPVLDVLNGTYRLGLLSNGNTYPERCGLAGYFDFTVFAQDHRARKPDLRFYRAALRHARLQAAALVHVGDSLTNDVAGAQAVGARAIWLNRHHLPNATAVRPDAEISSLSELAGVLSDMGMHWKSSYS